MAVVVGGRVLFVSRRPNSSSLFSPQIRTETCRLSGFRRFDFVPGPSPSRKMIVKRVLSTPRPEPRCGTNILRDCVAGLKPLAHFLEYRLGPVRILQSQDDSKRHSFGGELGFRTN